MSTVGSILREAREAKGLSVSDLAARTRIKMQQVNGLERDDFSVSPAPMYTKGFLKLCAQELDLDADELLALFVEQTAAVTASRPVAKAGAIKAKIHQAAPVQVPLPSPPPVKGLAEGAPPVSEPAPPRRVPVRASLRPAGTGMELPKRPLPNPLGALKKILSRMSLPSIPLYHIQPHLPKIGAGLAALLLLFLLVRGCASLSAGKSPPELREPRLLDPLPLRLPLPGASG